MEKKISNNYLVCIQCFTYNQAPYITDALNGFTMQQTTFPYIAMVVDDASTDGEQDVIATYVEEYFDTQNQEVSYKKSTDYAHITFAQHKTNKNCYIVVLYLKENHYSKGLHDKKLEYLSQWRDNTKYEALCEGDDYWIDPLKLHIQVNFLENNPEYGMCYTNFNTYQQNTKKTVKDVFLQEPQTFPIKYDNAEDFVLKAGYVCPPSWVYRTTCLPKQYLDYCDGTFFMFTHFLCTTKVYGMTKTTVTYRLLPESASRSSNYDKIYNRAKNILKMQYDLIDMYNLDITLKYMCCEKHYKTYLTSFIINNKKEDLQKANIHIKNKSIKERFLLFISKTNMGCIILRKIHVIYKMLKFNNI